MVENEAQETERTIARLHDLRRYDDVVKLSDAWLEARGTIPPVVAHFRSAALQGIREYGEAVAWGALACASIEGRGMPFIASRTNLALALWRTGDHANAVKLWRAVLREPCTDREGVIATAHLRLAIRPGQWRRGWRDYERRIGTDRAPDYGLPQWDGGGTDGPVVILHEQGIGDAVLFARYIPWVVQRSGHPVIFAGPEPLHRWVASVPGVQQCVSPSEALGTLTTSGPRMRLGSCITRWFSLPHLHHTTPDTIPTPRGGPTRTRGTRGWDGKEEAHPPSLAGILPDPPSSSSSTSPEWGGGEMWDGTQREVGGDSEVCTSPGGRGLRVGVCWRGSPDGHHDFERSMPFEVFQYAMPDLPGVAYVNLQWGDPGNDRLGPGPTGDVYATGEVVAGCDVVVTVDTSVGHLAGSLGVPCIVLPPSAPDWRYPTWAPDGTTPWYPSQVVVRRDRADEWEAQARSAGALVEGLVAQTVG